jgi:hypothetical protein
MNVLVGVTTCLWRKEYANSQRETWVKSSPYDVKFFIGHADNTDDIVGLPCRDDYKGLPQKVQEMCRWALANNYDYVCKVDDDCYVRPERLSSVVGDYVGLFREGSSYAHYGYCSGFGYCLSKKSLEIVANSPTPDLVAEDVWVSNQLHKNGIVATNDSRFLLTIKKESPTIYNDLIVAAEYKDMTEPHKRWIDSVSELEELSQSIAV